MGRTHSRFILVVSFLVGSIIMILEMSGFRMLAPTFGYDITVWASLIGIILFSLAVGYAVGGRIIDTWPTMRTLYIILTVAGVNLFLVLALYPVILHSLKSSGYGGAMGSVFLIFCPPMITLSMVSPSITRLLSSFETLGFTSGTVYGIATVGSIVGVYFSAFYALPTFGTRFTIALCFILTWIALLLAWYSKRLAAQ